MAVHNLDANLTAQQNEYTGRNRKDGQDDGQAAERDERGQACENEPDTQQHKTDIFL